MFSSYIYTIRSRVIHEFNVSLITAPIREQLTFLFHLVVVEQKADHFLGLEHIGSVVAAADHHLLNLQAHTHTRDVGLCVTTVDETFKEEFQH